MLWCEKNVILKTETYISKSNYNIITMKYDKFKGTIWKQGNSKILTIPKTIIDLLKLDEGDSVIVKIAKEVDKNEDNKTGAE